MPFRELSCAYRLAAGRARVVAHLAEPANYVGLSPLVVAVREVRAEEDGLVRYTAVERFRLLGVLRHDNAIEVSLRVSAAGDAVSGEVRSPAGVRMEYRFEVADEPSGGPGCLLTDTLRLRAPFGLLRFAASQAASVQRSRGRVLAERLT
ncbi:hypothetical protein [Phaeacidiphilus oryzae]|uniref:hypothetical protein n=1 Tax=Phaeacidiphilus oryzae TaxID=348818 RepID=UPI00055B0A7A|nr:hypothetical protein [Phaeacidiphilus oryzae]